MAQLRILLGLACLGVSVCAACGSSFTGGGIAGGGNAGEAAGPFDAGSGNSAATNNGGDAGETSAGSGGTGASAGSTSAGAAGKDGTAGAGGSNAGAGGSSAGAAGNGGGSGSSAGGGGAPDCKTLEAEYTPLLEKARACDKGSMDQCSASSKLNSIGSCGCPVLVNATSAATTAAQKKYKELEDNKCLNTGVMCGAVCLAPKVVSCAQQMSGTGNPFVCTAGSIIAN